MVHGRNLRAMWGAASALGAALGAVAALALFPDAAFARNPTGQFGLHLVGFALTIGILLGFSQWLVLRYTPWPPPRHSLRSLGLWIPATGLGVALMIMPLWWLDAAMIGLIVFAPVEVVARVVGPTLPAIALLALMQWALLRDHGLGDTGWITRTLIGGILGVTIGLVFSMLASRSGALPFEAMWALGTGLILGLFQAGALVRRLEAPPDSPRAGRPTARRRRPHW